MKICPLCARKLHWDGKKLYCAGEDCEYVEADEEGRDE